MKNGYLIFFGLVGIVCCVAIVIQFSDIELFTTQTDTDEIDGAVGRTFQIVIENFCDETVSCYLTVDTERYGVMFPVSSNTTVSAEVHEDKLPIKKDSYDISVFATLDSDEKATAENVTEYAEFSLYQEEAIFFVECTASH